VRHNIVYVIVVVTMQVLGGLLFAILLVNIRLGQNVIKTLFYVPVIVVAVAVAQMFRNIYSFQPEGLLNLILSFIGLGEFRDAWLSNPNTALLAVSIPEGWRFIGLYMIIFHAALLSIPREIEEAADPDFATAVAAIASAKKGPRATDPRHTMDDISTNLPHRE
jgi:raffinose/stachyose/melibiose transport system permease protein